MGEVPAWRGEYKFIPRFSRPAFALGTHLCHPEWFDSGEPPNDLPPTTYLAGWIPTCCVMPCEFEACTSNPVNGQPASQFILYPIAATSADATTPAFQLQQAEAGSTVGGNWPQETFSWFPSGTGSASAFDWTMLAQPDGTPFSSVRQFTIDANNNFTETQDASGWAFGSTQSGAAFEIRLRDVAGVGQLTGSNLKVDPSLLPPLPYPSTLATPVAASGSTQANAKAIVQTHNQLQSSNATRGWILPAWDAGTIWLALAPTLGGKLYPPVGVSINSLAANAPLTLTGPSGALHHCFMCVSIAGGTAGGFWKVFDMGML